MPWTQKMQLHTGAKRIGSIVKCFGKFNLHDQNFTWVGLQILTTGPKKMVVLYVAVTGRKCTLFLSLFDHLF